MKKAVSLFLISIIFCQGAWAQQIHAHPTKPLVDGINVYQNKVYELLSHENFIEHNSITLAEIMPSLIQQGKMVEAMEADTSEDSFYTTMAWICAVEHIMFSMGLFLVNWDKFYRLTNKEIKYVESQIQKYVQKFNVAHDKLLNTLAKENAVIKEEQIYLRKLDAKLAELEYRMALNQENWGWRKYFEDANKMYREYQKSIQTQAAYYRAMGNLTDVEKVASAGGSLTEEKLQEASRSQRGRQHFIQQQDRLISQGMRHFVDKATPHFQKLEVMIKEMDELRKTQSKEHRSIMEEMRKSKKNILVEIKAIRKAISSGNAKIENDPNNYQVKKILNNMDLMIKNMDRSTQKLSKGAPHGLLDQKKELELYKKEAMRTNTLRVLGGYFVVTFVLVGVMVGKKFFDSLKDQEDRAPLNISLHSTRSRSAYEMEHALMHGDHHRDIELAQKGLNYILNNFDVLVEELDL